jgi:O-antigen/teichoic acid export membrane protein
LFIILLCVFCLSVLFLFREQILAILDIPQAYASALKYALFTIPAVTFNNFFLSWFKWKRQKIYFLICSGMAILLLMIPLLLAGHVSFLYIFQVLLFSQLATTLISIILASDYLRPLFSWKLTKTLLIYGFPWMLVFIFGSSRNYLDRFFLTSSLDDDNYGLYNFSVRISTLLSVIITAFDMSFGPLAYSIWNKEGAATFFARLQSVYIFLISAAACAVSIIAPVVIQFLGGTKYQGAEKVLPLLLFAAIPLSLINFSNLGTAYAKKSFLSTLTLFIGLMAVLIFNILLTKRYLQYGATTASLIGHLVIIITGYVLSRKYYPIPFKYLKDSLLFFFFFILSLLFVNFRLNVAVYANVAAQLLVLGLVMALILVYLFPEEFRKIRVRLTSLRRKNA